MFVLHVDGFFFKCVHGRRLAPYLTPVPSWSCLSSSQKCQFWNRVVSKLGRREPSWESRNGGKTSWRFSLRQVESRDTEVDRQGNIQKAETKSGKSCPIAGKDGECEAGNWASVRPRTFLKSQGRKESTCTRTQTHSIWDLGRGFCHPGISMHHLISDIICIQVSTQHFWRTHSGNFFQIEVFEQCKKINLKFPLWCNGTGGILGALGCRFDP